MAYSGDPSASDLDQLRFLLGDTDAEAEIFTDAELTFTMTQYEDNPIRAAAYLAGVRASQLADKRDRAVGPLSLSYGEQYQRWVETQQRLERMANSLHSRPGRRRLPAAELFGGGRTYLGPDDTPLTYNEGEYTDVVD